MLVTYRLSCFGTALKLCDDQLDLICRHSYQLQFTSDASVSLSV